MTGRCIVCGNGWVVFEVSLTAYIITSKMCGSIVMVHWPSFVIESLGGLSGLSFETPFFLVGFVQYLSNMPSLIHFFRERSTDSTITPLRRED